MGMEKHASGVGMEEFINTRAGHHEKPARHYLNYAKHFVSMDNEIFSHCFVAYLAGALQFL